MPLEPCFQIFGTAGISRTVFTKENVDILHWFKVSKAMTRTKGLKTKNGEKIPMLWEEKNLR
jgi:hypothetical protein